MPSTRSEHVYNKDIISNRIHTYPEYPRSPACSPPQHSPSRYYTNHYSQSSVPNDWSNYPQEYPPPPAGVDRDTLNDREDDNCTINTKQSLESMPNDEDCISFFSSPTPTPMDPNSDGRDDSDSEAGLFLPQVEKHDLPTFGPKMRFVSPPPWETPQGKPQDNDDEDNVSLSDGLSMFSGGFTFRKYREQVPTRSPALASIRTPSPTPTTSSRGPYGKANPKASQSQVSLSIKDVPWASRSTLELPSSERPSFSLSIRDNGASPALLTDQSTKQNGRAQYSPLSQEDDSTFSSRSDSPTSVGPYTHPYANPDVIPASNSLKLSSDPAPYHQQRQSGESDLGYVRRVSESVTARVPPTFRKTSAGNLPSSQTKPASRSMRTKYDEKNNEIPLLPPMSRGGTTGLPSARTHSSHSPVPFPDSPMKNLMTLEEAKRIKSGTAGSPTQTRIRSGSTLIAGFGLPPGANHDFEVKRNQSLSPSDSSSTIRDTKIPNARQRTISSSKLSIISSSPSNDDIVPTKTLKHKKSGFMKLFGKDKESLKSEPPSPSSKTSVTPTEVIPPVPKRVPPPSLSVVVTSPSTSFPEIEASNQQQQKSSPPTQQVFPTVTSTSLSPVENDPSPWNAESRTILSAPPSQSRFEGLSLRPMSTAFSAKFSELFSALDDSVSLLPPVMPAASKSSGGGSPTTSDFSSRSNSSDYPITPSSTALPGAGVNIVGRHEDSVASLQAQLINLQKNHQREIWELESQIRDLRQVNEELRNTGNCESCGKSKREGRLKSNGSANQTSVVDRPRPKVSRDTRSVFGGN